MKTQLIENMKETKEIENNEMYKFLCDIYTEINHKIIGVHILLLNIFTFSSGLKNEFRNFITKIKKLQKGRKKLISDFTSNLKIFIEKKNQFTIFIYGNKTEVDKIKKEYNNQRLEIEWSKINEEQKQILERDKTILKLFPENLEKLLEYSGNNELINDKKKQKYEKLLFDEKENIESFFKTKGKFVEVQPFWPYYFEEIMISGTTNFDVVKKMFDDFAEYLGGKKKELLSKYDIFLKLKEIFFGTTKEISFDVFDTPDKKLVILDYLNHNRSDLEKRMMKEELLKSLLKIFKEVQEH